MNVVEFVEDSALIGDKHLSPAQRMSLKAVYGLPLTAAELDLFRQTTGLPGYVRREWAEATFILGRRAGKSDKLASNIALYEALGRTHKLSKGETGVCMIVASELSRQARIVFRYIEGKLEGSKILRRMIARKTADEIELTNGITIQVFPCNLARIRGASLVCFIADEAAFWKVEGRSVDREVLDAARPGLSFPNSKMIKISSPWMQRGEVYQDFKRYYGKPNSDVLVFQGDTKLFNPTFSEAKLEAARKRDPVAYDCEHLAHFRTDISAMYDPAIIDQAADPDRPAELPFRWGTRYVAFADVAGGGGKDSYALAIGHAEGERIIVDVVRSRAPKFNPEDVTRQYCELLKGYGIAEISGDKFSGDFASNAFAKYGVDYKRAEKSKSELYLEAEGAFNTGRVSLPSRELLLPQLKSLVRKTRSGGRDSVDTDAGQPEDEANVCAGIIAALAGEAANTGPYIGTFSHSILPGQGGRGDDDIGRRQRKAFMEFIRVGKR